MATIAKFKNTKGFTITIDDNFNYLVKDTDGTERNANLRKWYKNPTGVVRHIHNDIIAGYYPQDLILVEDYE